MSEPPWRPSKQELVAAAGRTIADVLAPGLAVVFCGINPGLYSGAVGHHFARPGNRFWEALYGAGFTDTVLSPFEDRRLLEYGIGITNLVARTTARADELSAGELKSGAAALQDKLRMFRPKVVAVLGLGAYRAAFDRRAQLGEQPERLAGARLFVLANPSGLQARYQLGDLIKQFAQIKQVLETGMF